MNCKLDRQAFEEGFKKQAMRGIGQTPAPTMGSFRPILDPLINRVGRSAGVPNAANAVHGFMNMKPEERGQAFGMFQKMQQLPEETRNLAANAFKDATPEQIQGGVKAFNDVGGLKGITSLQEKLQPFGGFKGVGETVNKVTGIAQQHPLVAQLLKSFATGHGQMAAAKGLLAGHPYLAAAGGLGAAGVGAYGLYKMFGGGSQASPMNVNVNVTQPGAPVTAKSNTWFPQQQGVQNPEMDPSKTAATLPQLADSVISSVIDPVEVPDKKLHVSIQASSPRARKMLKNPDYKAYIRNMVENADRQAAAVKDNI